MNTLKGWKTVIFNAAIVIFAAIKLIAPDAELPTPDQITPVIDQGAASIMAVYALANLALRAVTNSEIFKKF